MSRTYRRKNATHEAWRYNYEWEWNGHTIYKRFLEGDELKRAKAKFHADNNAGIWNPPKYFRKRLNNEVRERNRQILRRAVREGNDEPMFVPNVKNAGYLWW